MKDTLRSILWPILKPFETGDEEFSYASSHRKILFVIGGLFLLLSFGAIFATMTAGVYGGLIPATVFFAIGFVCSTVAFLGSDRAVAKIWRNR